jgi:hypothetical protein
MHVHQLIAFSYAIADATAVCMQVDLTTLKRAIAPHRPLKRERRVVRVYDAAVACSNDLRGIALQKHLLICLEGKVVT